MLGSGLVALKEKGRTVNQALQSSSSEPPLSSQEVSFPARAFGYDTSRYQQFLQALLDGLRAYEAQVGGRHAEPPIPAA